MFLIETPKRESGLVKIISVNASLELYSGNVFDKNLLSFKMKTEHERKIRLHTIYILYIRSIALFEDYVGGNDIIIIWTF